MTEAEHNWHLLRQSGLGGTDMARLAGSSPWGTAADVYVEKTTPIVYSPVEESINITHQRGHYLEPLICKYYAQRNNVQVFHNSDNMIQVHPIDEFFYITPDALIPEKNTGLEIKTVAGDGAKRWDDGVPEHVYIQIQHAINVYGYDSWELAYLINDTYRELTIPRNDEVIRNLTEIGTEFWLGNVIPKIPPTPTNEKEWNLLMRESCKGKEIQASTEVVECLADMTACEEVIDRLMNDKKTMEDKLSKLKFYVKMYMDDAEILTYNGLTLATLKQTTNNRRPLRIKRDNLLEVYNQNNSYIDTTADELPPLF